MLGRKIFFEIRPLNRKYTVPLSLAFIVSTMVIGLAVIARHDGPQQQFVFATNVVEDMEIAPESASNTVSDVECMRGALPNRTLVPDEICRNPDPEVSFVNYDDL